MPPPMIGNRCMWDPGDSPRCVHAGAIWVFDLWLCLVHARVVIAIRETVVAERDGHALVADVPKVARAHG